MPYLLLETIKIAKRLRNERNLYHLAGEFKKSNSIYGDPRFADVLQDHAKLVHHAFKAHIKMLRHKLTAPADGNKRRYNRVLKQLEGESKKRRQIATANKRKMLHKLKRYSEEYKHTEALNTARNHMKRWKPKRAPEWRSGESVFPGLGKRRKDKNRFGNIDNGCVLSSVQHATGKHPHKVISAFTRQINHPTNPWNPDGGANNLHMREALRRLNHKATEIPFEKITKLKRIRGKNYHVAKYTAGELAKMHPKGNIIATSQHRLITGGVTHHAFNIKNGKIHDAHGIANEDTQVIQAHRIHEIKRNYNGD